MTPKTPGLGEWKTLDEVVSELEQHRKRTRWGRWRLDAKVRVLAFYENGRWLYEVDLDRCRTCAELLDWIYQLHGKRWLSDRDLRDFLNAVDDVVDGVQAKYCSFGNDLTQGRGDPNPDANGSQR